MLKLSASPMKDNVNLQSENTKLQTDKELYTSRYQFLKVLF